MSKNLIVYFSRKGENYVNGGIQHLTVGNTEVAAKLLQECIDSTLFEVQTVHAYAEDYTTCTKEAQEEKRNNARPKLLDYVHQFVDYDHIFLLYPNWWNTMPMAMFTFLEMHPTQGKHIYPLCTHEGSGLGNSVQDIKNCCPDAIVEKGLAIQGSYAHNAKKDIESWLKEVMDKGGKNNGNI